MARTGLQDVLRTRLLDRRERLAATIELAPNSQNFRQLLEEVDAALDRLTTGRYGICETCNEPIEQVRLRVDPLLRYCTTHVSPEEQVKVLRDQALAVRLGVVPKEFFRLGEPELLGRDEPQFQEPDVTGAWKLPEVRAPMPLGRRWRLIEALKAAWMVLRSGVKYERERDMDVVRASNIQSGLLPKSDLYLNTWDIYYDYASAGPVGGDYCDLFIAKTDELFLFLGDVMGKGIAASMILSRLQAVFRTLLDLELPIEELLERANRIFCECVQTTGYYATLVCVRASSTGTVELINAGHLPPLVLRAKGAERVVATGIPLGLFYSSTYDVIPVQLAEGETILFYTDGVTEARNGSDSEYGQERLARVAIERSHLAPKELVRACRDDVSAFTSKAPLSDDLTLLAMRRV